MDISTVPDSASVQKLSQYLKKTCLFGRDEMTTTMDWFPAAEQVQKKSELSSSSFLNDFPPLPAPDLMAKEILLLLANNKKPSSAPSPAAAAAAMKSSSPPPPPNPIKQQPYHQQRKVEADILPMVRRVSLSRFLEKRKDRMMATAPYR